MASFSRKRLRLLSGGSKTTHEPEKWVRRGREPSQAWPKTLRSDRPPGILSGFRAWLPTRAQRCLIKATGAGWLVDALSIVRKRPPLLCKALVALPDEPGAPGCFGIRHLGE